MFKWTKSRSLPSSIAYWRTERGRQKIVIQWVSGVTVGTAPRTMTHAPPPACMAPLESAFVLQAQPCNSGSGSHPLWPPKDVSHAALFSLSHCMFFPFYQIIPTDIQTHLSIFHLKTKQPSLDPMIPSLSLLILSLWGLSVLPVFTQSTLGPSSTCQAGSCLIASLKWWLSESLRASIPAKTHSCFCLGLTQLWQQSHTIPFFLKHSLGFWYLVLFHLLHYLPLSPESSSLLVLLLTIIVSNALP